MEMTDLDRRRREHVAHLEHELQSIVEQLRAMEAVQKVILFGSWARSRRDLGSDLDLIVVMDSALDFVSRSVAVAKRLQTGAPLDLLVYTPDEVNRMAQRPFLRQALQEGVVLYAR